MRNRGKVPLLIAVALFTGVAMADDKPLDVTITVVESPADLPASVTKTIELPLAAAAHAHEHAPHGLDAANEAHEHGREFGQDIAEEAKAKHGNTEGGSGKGRGRGRGRGGPP